MLFSLFRVAAESDIDAALQVFKCRGQSDGARFAHSLTPCPLQIASASASVSSDAMPNPPH